MKVVFSKLHIGCILGETRLYNSGELLSVALASAFEL
jgi:hypothetical protein